MRELALAVARRAASKGMIGRTITLKVKWSNFQIVTRQQPLASPTAQGDMLAEVAETVLRQEIAPLLDGVRAIRLLGVALSALCPASGSAGVVRQVRAGHDLVQPSLWDRLVG